MSQARRVHWKTAALLVLLGFGRCATALAQAPFVYSALNAASYDSAVLAQGSLIVIYGSGMGPSTLVQAPSLPLPAVLAGTSVTVGSAPALNCTLLYTSDGQVAVVLPSATPLGRTTLTVAYNGAQGSASSIPIEVVGSSVGIFTVNGSGSAGGIFTAPNGALRTGDQAAKTADILTVWVTGAGPAGEPAGGVPTTFPNFPGVEVLAGPYSAKVIYAGRSGCCAALDQISFEMPPSPAGCFVPVAVRSGGHVSNFVSLPVASSGSACADTGPVIAPSLVSQAAAGQPVKLGIIGVGPTGVLAGLGFSSGASLAGSLSAALGVRVTAEEADRVLRAAQTGNRRALDRALVRYAPALKKLDPKAKARLLAQLRFNQSGAYGAFTRFDSAAVAGPQGASLFTPAGTCTVLGSPAIISGQPPLDAGSSLSLTGPGGPWTLKAVKPGQYQAAIGPESVAGSVAPGAYTIAGSGGRDVGAFSATANLTAAPVILNKSALALVDPGLPLNINWSAAPGYAFVWIGGYTPDGAFVCTEAASRGNFQIPPHVIAAVTRRGATKATFFIGAHPLSWPIPVPGLDAAFFFDGSFDSAPVTLQAAVPIFTISKSHTGNFTAGQTGVYTIVVRNTASAAPTSGTVTVKDAAPPGMLVASMAGTGWSCAVDVCTRSDVLAAGSAWPPISVTAAVSNFILPQVANLAIVSGGGSQDFTTASDVTKIVFSASQTVVLSDRNAFLAQSGPNSIAGFEDVPPNTNTPFVSNGVSFTGPGQVVNTLVGLGTSFWFPGSGTNFLLTNFNIQAAFPADVKAAGFDYHCFACALSPTDVTVSWQLRSASGTIVDSGATVSDFTNGVKFFGMISAVPFRSITITAGPGNWTADNVRSAP